MAEAARPSRPPSTSQPEAVPEAARPLSDLAVGAWGEVEHVTARPAVTARLLDLGFVPGTKIEVLRRAPLGDPVLYGVRGAKLCLRRSEASRILVRPAEPGS